MKSIHIGIRLQLIILILLVVGISVSIFAIVTGVSTSSYVLNLRGERLQVVAMLKSSQIAQAFSSLYFQVAWISNRPQLQEALARYRAGNHSEANWAEVNTFFNATLGSYSVIMGAGIYTPEREIVYNVTNSSWIGPFDTLDSTLLPLHQRVKLPVSMTELGGTIVAPAGIPGSPMSISLPVTQNTTLQDTQSTVGYVTLILNTMSIGKVVEDTTGIDSQGDMVLVEGVPNYLPNRDYTKFRYIVGPKGTPPCNVSKCEFDIEEYSAVRAALEYNRTDVYLDTETTRSDSMSVGFSPVDVRFATWAVLIEEPHKNIYSPIQHLKRIVIGTSFGVAGFIIVVAVPVAYFAVKPIYRLKKATELTKREFHNADPLSRSPSNPSFKGGAAAAGVGELPPNDYDKTNINETTNDPDEKRMKSNTTNNTSDEEAIRASEIEHKTTDSAETATTLSGIGKALGLVKKMFFIRDSGPQETSHKAPNKVPISARFYRDELTDLCETYNQMSEELVKHYLHLEDRVAERTKQLEEARIAAEKANEAKSQFIANITHELRTPLNGILGMTAVSLTENDPSKIRRSLGVIFQSGELLLHLLNDLLTFSKNQIGNLQLDEKEFMLKDVIGQLNYIFRKQAYDRNITLKYIIFNELASYRVLYGDSSRILQILVNLISNSLKFTPSGGNVTVRVRCLGDPFEARKKIGGLPSKLKPRSSAGILLSHSQSASINRNLNSLLTETLSRGEATEVSRTHSLSSATGSLRGLKGRSASIASSSDQSTAMVVSESAQDLIFEFAVEDNGPGIAESMQEKIFEPFVQGDQALSRKFGGTGLGLSICKQLATLMGGRMTLKSNLGRGSTFKLQIPMKNTRIISGMVYPDQLYVPDEIDIDQLPDLETHIDSTNRLIDGPEPTGKDLCRTPSAKSSKTQSDSYFAAPATTAPRRRSVDKPLSSVASRARSASVLSRMESVRVMIAEDNVVNQEIIKRMLRLEGIHDITVAMDGEKVVSKIEEAIKDGVYFDIIFMDIQMPRFNGLEATRFIRGTLGYPYTIIAMTAYADKSSEAECIDAGMNGILNKPVMRNNLQKILNDYCPGAPLHEPSVPAHSTPSPV